MEKQIERYIDIEKKKYKENNIYILYLTSTGGYPLEKSISFSRIQEFGNRFKGISYSKEILVWLNNLKTEEFEKPDCEHSELLRSAIVQYKDFLETKFFLREKEIKMKTEIKKAIETHLGLTGEHEILKKINIINKFKDDIVSSLDMTIEELQLSIFDEFVATLNKNDFQDIKNIVNSKRFGMPWEFLKFEPKNWNNKYVISFSWDGIFEGLRFGILVENAKADKEPDISKLFHEKIGNIKDSEILEIGNSYYSCSFFKNNTFKEDEIINQIKDGSLKKYFIETINLIIEKTKDIKELY